MPIAKIPLANTSLFRNVDQAAVANQLTDLWNGYIDELGYIHRRPGYESFVDLGTGKPVDGLYWWQERRVLLAVSGGHLYSIEEDGTAADLGSGLEVGIQVSFASINPAGIHNVIMANGGGLYKTSGGALSAIADPDAPVNVTSLTFLDQYIIANNSETPYFYYSGVNDPDSWSALDFATAEVRPDDTTGVATNWDELFVLGTESVEVWYNDGSTPFVRRDGATINRGTLSPYTFKRVGNTFMMLDSKRHVVNIEGRNPVIVSNEIDDDLAEIRDIEDAFAMVMDIEGRAFYVLSFPRANRTYAYDYKMKAWARWGQYQSEHGVYDRFGGNSYAFCTDWNKHVIGSKDDGRVYTMASSINADGDSYNRLRVQTGHIDHGVLSNKRSRDLRLRGKRGSTSQPGSLMLRVRDNGTGQWSREYILDTGAAGDYVIDWSVFLGGIYRTRQYEITATDNVPVLFGEAEEEVEVLLN